MKRCPGQPPAPPKAGSARGLSYSSVSTGREANTHSGRYSEIRLAANCASIWSFSKATACPASTAARYHATEGRSLRQNRNNRRFWGPPANRDAGTPRPRAPHRSRRRPRLRRSGQHDSVGRGHRLKRSFRQSSRRRRRAPGRSRRKTCRLLRKRSPAPLPPPCRSGPCGCLPCVAGTSPAAVGVSSPYR